MTCFSDAGVGAAGRDALQPRVGQWRHLPTASVREGARAVRHVVPLLDGGRGAAPPADGENSVYGCVNLCVTFRSLFSTGSGSRLRRGRWGS